jgi:hypothetical protein
MPGNRTIILVVILLITVCITAYVLLVAIPRRMTEQSYEGARRIGRDLKELFQVTPEISVNNKIIVQQEAEIMELASLSQKFHHTYTWRNIRLGSTKEIEVSGTFESKAGFDLNEKFRIQITDGKATVQLPTPRLLSLELLGDIEFRDEHGYWNWVNAGDRTRAINAFMQDARRHANETLNSKKVNESTAGKLAQIIRAHVREVEIRAGGKVITPPSIDFPE